ncbi:MAG: hypothetical protein ACJ788_07480 [Ktedonobacteraceae bacterium]
MPEDIIHEQQKRAGLDVELISWWSWRPGIRPRNALVSGGLITVVALLLAGTGLVTLVLAILHSFSPPGQVTGSVSLLLLGGIMLPYPALLLIWGWQDLFASRESSKRCTLTGKVVGLRASVATRRRSAGLVPHAPRPWYGVALQFTDGAGEQQVTTFALSQERYMSLHEGDTVTITYSPHVHYVFALDQVSL